MLEHEDNESIPIINKFIQSRYKRPYFGRKTLNILIGLFFLSFFLGIFDILLIPLSLVPWSIAGVIVVYNIYLGNSIQNIDPIVLRDGHIEVDQCFSLWSAIKNDRFIPMSEIGSIEILHFIETTFILQGIDPSPKMEANTILIKTKHGQTFSINRQPWIISNFVKQLNSWNEARTEHINASYAAQNDERASILHFGPESFLTEEKSSIDNFSSSYLVFSTVFTFIIPVFFLYLLSVMVTDGDSNDAGDVFLGIIIAMSVIMIMFDASFHFINALVRPPFPLLLCGIEIGAYDMILKTLGKGEMVIPYDEIRGICPVTKPGHPQDVVTDLLFTLKPEWGYIVIDEHILVVKIDVANILEERYHRRFGFYPQSLHYRRSISSRMRLVTDYDALQSKPKGMWERIKLSKSESR